MSKETKTKTVPKSQTLDASVYWKSKTPLDVVNWLAYRATSRANSDEPEKERESRELAKNYGLESLLEQRIAEIEAEEKEEIAAGDYTRQSQSVDSVDQIKPVLSIDKENIREAEKKLLIDQTAVKRDGLWNDMLSNFFPGLKDLGEYEVCNPGETLEMLKQVYPHIDKTTYVNFNGSLAKNDERFQTPVDFVQVIRGHFISRRDEFRKRANYLRDQLISGTFDYEGKGLEIMETRLGICSEQAEHFARALEIIDEIIANAKGAK